MFPTYQQVPYVLLLAALVANPPPLLRTGQLLQSVTVFENDSQSSTATAAALMRDVPPTMASDSTATSGAVSEPFTGWCEKVDPIAMHPKIADIPVIA